MRTSPAPEPLALAAPSVYSTHSSLRSLSLLIVYWFCCGTMALLPTGTSFIKSASICPLMNLLDWLICDDGNVFWIRVCTGCCFPCLTTSSTALTASFDAARYMNKVSFGRGLLELVSKKGNDFSADRERKRFSAASFPAKLCISPQVLSDCISAMSFVFVGLARMPSE
ncbi:hypothetical protein Tco_1271166, partial [Tanacetum coccineum]